MELKQGWICPECKTINSPYHKTCYCSKVSCHFCEKSGFYFDEIGYGSRYDGLFICHNCMNLAGDILLLVHRSLDPDSVYSQSDYDFIRNNEEIVIHILKRLKENENI